MAEPEERDSTVLRAAEGAGRGVAGGLGAVGFGTTLVSDSLYWLLLGRRKGQAVRARPVFAEMMEIGIRAIPIVTLLAVTIVAFAMTTLDTATRLLRFNVEEICRSLRLNFLANRYFGSLLAVAGIAFFGLVPAGKVLWTLFGTTNQLLASLTLLTISVFLFKLSRPIIYTIIPMILMLVVSVWAMSVQMLGFWNKLSTVWEAAGLSSDDRLLSLLRFWTKEFWDYPENSLIWVCAIVMLMSFWLIVEALLSFTRGRGGLQLENES